MSQKLIQPPKEDKVDTLYLFGHTYRRSRFFAAFLICCALLVAAFAITGVWQARGGGDGGGAASSDDTTAGDSQKDDAMTAAPSGDASDSSQVPPADGTDDAPSLTIPEGATPIRDADLSAPHLGPYYVHNATSYAPNVEALLATDVSSPTTKEPLVLILHTHASESYLPSGTQYVEGAVGDVTYSEDPAENMIAVGEELRLTLQQKGITAIHCTVMHDEKGFSSAYTRAEESIRFYLTHYPSIRYVIDLHRDAVMDAEGNYIRAVCGDEEEPVAQVMAVVGSDAGGSHHPNWEGNLALALSLRARLDALLPSLARPISLRNETYNQELAPYSLLLEIGTGANSQEEALRAVRLVGEALADLISP